MKIVYYVATIAFTGFYLFSVFGYLTQGEFWAGEYVRLGFPAYLVTIMTIVKPLGVLAVWVRRPVWLAQLAYAGFFYHLLLAFMAHAEKGETVPAMIPLVLLVALLASFFTQDAARTPPKGISFAA